MSSQNTNENPWSLRWNFGVGVNPGVKTQQFSQNEVPRPELWSFRVLFESSLGVVWVNQEHFKIILQIRKNSNNKKAYDTQYSQPVTHVSTNWARRSLTSEIGRDRVYSTWYGRKRQFILFFIHIA